VIMPYLGKEDELVAKVLSECAYTPEQVAVISFAHDALARGEDWALKEMKGYIIDATIPFTNDEQTDYQGALQEDFLTVARYLVEDGNYISIFTSGQPAWLMPALWNANPEMAEGILEVHVGPKADPTKGPQAFAEVYDKEKAARRQVVCHTADELPELEHALRYQTSGGPSFNLVYVARNQSTSEARVREAGIPHFTTNLMEVDYQNMIKKE